MIKLILYFLYSSLDQKKMKLFYLKIIIILFLVFYSSNAFASVDQNINDFLEPIASLISGIVFYSLPIGSANVELIVIWLIAGGLFSTFYFKFINFRGFKHSLELVSGKFSKKESKGEVSHFKALATALSCLLYTSPSPRDLSTSRMPSSA